MKRSRVRRRCASMSGRERSLDALTGRLEVAFLFLLFHRAGSVEIDDPTLPLRDLGLEQLADDRGECRRVALDRTGERVAPQRPESYRAQARPLVGGERQTIVVHHDEAS